MGINEAYLFSDVSYRVNEEREVNETWIHLSTRDFHRTRIFIIKSQILVFSFRNFLCRTISRPYLWKIPTKPYGKDRIVRFGEAFCFLWLLPQQSNKHRDPHLLCMADFLHFSCFSLLHASPFRSPWTRVWLWSCLQLRLLACCHLRLVLCLHGLQSWVYSGFALFLLLGRSQHSCPEARVFSGVEGIDYLLFFFPNSMLCCMWLLYKYRKRQIVFGATFGFATWINVNNCIPDPSFIVFLGTIAMFDCNNVQHLLT